jgi:DNA polymerase-3 subunit gamma/tau
MSGVASGCLRHFSSAGQRGSRAGGQRASLAESPELSCPAARLPIWPTDMISLARRYRPKRFSDLLVQDHVAGVLRGAISRGRVAHGYLLTGPRGVGKTTAARILAMALNCAHRDPGGDPCGDCENCLRIWNGSANLDVVEIDAASNRGVDDARDLRERAMYAASREGHYKVYIIDEAHMLTREAWNALLKILEEPPPGVVFVFATTEPQKIAASAAPVMSRLQRFDFRRIGPHAIRDRLRQVLSAEGLSADDDALTLIARHADGGMRDALSVMDQCLSFGDGAVSAQRVREVLGLADDELYEEMLRLVVEHDPAAVFPLVDRLSDAGVDLTEFVSGAAEVLRGVLMLQVGAEPEELTEAVRGTLERYRERLEPGDVLRMLQMLHDNEVNIRRNVNSRLTVETLLLRWAMLDRIVDLEEVLAQAGQEVAGKRGGREAATAAPVITSGARPELAPSDAASPRPRVPASPPLASPPPSVPAAPPPTAKLAPSIEAIRAGWPAIVVAARVQSRFLGELLASVEPSELALPWLNVVMREPNQLFAERLEQEATKVEEILSRSLGQPVRLRVSLAAPPDGPPPATRRLSDASIKADRLREFRSKDPALDTAADALDLEIVD